jgi:hypothetical protein
VPRGSALVLGALPDFENLIRSRAYTSAVFSETRYAVNGDLRVAYRASRGVLATSCTSRTGSPVASIFQSYRSFKGGSRR